MTTANTNVIAKIAAVVAGLGLVAMTFAPFAKAATQAELEAQVTALLAQIKSLQTGSTSTAMSSGVSFNTNLMVGSKGSEVTALQNFLIKAGMTIPAGATGSFGGQTKAALASWQAAHGVTPASGYFGPITRAKVNGMGGSMTGGTTTTGGSNSGSTSGITTIGAEGTINIEKETSGIKTNLYEGDMKARVLGVRIEAKDSDMNINRIRVNLGTTTDTYVKQFGKIYFADADGVILASKDLNSSTVTRVSGSPAAYYVTLSGFNYTVKQNTKKSFYVHVDVYQSVNSSYYGNKTLSLYGSDAISAVDGAGIYQYSTGADATVTQNVTIQKSLSDSASLTISTDPSVRKATTIVANKGSNNNETDKEEVGSFRVLAEKDNVLVRDLSVTVSNTSTSTANLQTLYLMDGSTQVGSASGDVNGKYLFASVNQTLTKDAYKTYTLKADFRSVANGATVKVGAVAITSAESVGTGSSVVVAPLSAAAGENMLVIANGVTATLTTPTIDIVTSKDTAGSTTEAHLTATFNMTLTAVGSDVTFGAPGSAFVFAILKNGTSVTPSLATKTVYYPATQPTGTTAYTPTGFVLPRNATITIPVTVKLDAANTAAVGADLASANYAVRLNTMNYTTAIGAGANDYSTNATYVTAEKARP
jgi:Putative peptidoglycan binding domain